VDNIIFVYPKQMAGFFLAKIGAQIPVGYAGFRGEFDATIDLIVGSPHTDIAPYFPPIFIHAEFQSLKFYRYPQVHPEGRYFEERAVFFCSEIRARWRAEAIFGLAVFIRAGVGIIGRAISIAVGAWRRATLIGSAGHARCQVISIRDSITIDIRTTPSFSRPRFTRAGIFPVGYAIAIFIGATLTTLRPPFFRAGVVPIQQPIPIGIARGGAAFTVSPTDFTRTGVFYIGNRIPV